MWIRTFLMVCFGVVSFVQLSHGGETKAPSVSSAIWDVASIPAEVRHRIHVFTDELPGFPEDDATLEDVNNWPRERTFNEHSCTLVLQAGGGDYTRRIPSTSKLKDDENLLVGYECPQIGMERKVRRGPACSWNQFGQLVERSYHWSDGLRFQYLGFQYYPEGEIFSYFTRERNEDLSGHFDEQTEYYDVQGNLVGFEIGYSASGGPHLFFFWEGKAISQEAFQEEQLNHFNALTAQFSQTSNRENTGYMGKGARH